MNILILNGSPHKSGTTSVLTESYIRGAKDQGHDVTVFDVNDLEVHPCIGCDHCRKTDDGCIYKDSMEQINPILFAADRVVLVTPIYYFGMTTQLKAVIDRFYGNNEKLRAQDKQFSLITACGDIDSWAMDGLKAHYACLCRYMGWQDVGALYAIGMYVKSDLDGSGFPEQAYEMAIRQG